MKTITRNEGETIEAAKAFAGTLDGTRVICLNGTLGAGKSVFARALIRSLCGDESLNVPSPTFTLVQMYDCDIAPIYHYDLYRLEDADEVYALGWDEAMHEGISIIEWPERAERLIPTPYTAVTINVMNDTTRDITIEDIT